MPERPRSERSDVWGPPTDWALVAGASRARTGPDADRAWHDLVERYRHPVKLAVRRKLRGADSADNLIDAFFSYLYTADVLARVDPDRGRFRCFIQVVLKRFLARDYADRMRRRDVALESDVAAAREAPEIEREEEADWASAVLRLAINALTEEQPRGAELLLRSHGVAPYPLTSSEALCAAFDLKPNALYQALFRARRRLRELVLAEIRRTVLTEQDYEVEKDVIIARLLEASSYVFVDAG